MEQIITAQARVSVSIAETTRSGTLHWHLAAERFTRTPLGCTALERGVEKAY